MSSRRQRLLARLNWYLQSSLKHITEYITGNKTYYRGGRYRQVSLYRVIIKHPAVDDVYVPIMKMMHIFTGQHFDIKQNYFCKQQHYPWQTIFPLDSFMSCLHSLLGYFTGEQKYRRQIYRLYSCHMWVRLYIQRNIAIYHFLSTADVLWQSLISPAIINQ